VILFVWHYYILYCAVNKLLAQSLIFPAVPVHGVLWTSLGVSHFKQESKTPIPYLASALHLQLRSCIFQPSRVVLHAIMYENSQKMLSSYQRLYILYLQL